MGTISPMTRPRTSEVAGLESRHNQVCTEARFILSDPARAADLGLDPDRLAADGLEAYAFAACVHHAETVAQSRRFDLGDYQTAVCRLERAWKMLLSSAVA